MALVADDASDRADQLTLLTERLTALIQAETQAIIARVPPPAQPDSDEKARLTNAYRLEMARIKQDPELLRSADPRLLQVLRQRSETLQAALHEHEIQLAAVRMVCEGLVEAMAHEMARQRNSSGNYGSNGGAPTLSGPSPIAIDRKA